MPFRRIPPQNLFSSPSKPDHHIIAYTDGGARGNPGPAGYGVFITDERGQKLAELSQYLGNQTNNVAEYQGLPMVGGASPNGTKNSRAERLPTFGAAIEQRIPGQRMKSSKCCLSAQ